MAEAMVVRWPRSVVVSLAASLLAAALGVAAVATTWPTSEARPVPYSSLSLGPERNPPGLRVGGGTIAGRFATPWPPTA